MRHRTMVGVYAAVRLYFSRLPTHSIGLCDSRRRNRGVCMIALFARLRQQGNRQDVYTG